VSGPPQDLAIAIVALDEFSPQEKIDSPIRWHRVFGQLRSLSQIGSPFYALIERRRLSRLSNSLRLLCLSQYSPPSTPDTPSQDRTLRHDGILNERQYQCTKSVSTVNRATGPWSTGLA
jgi:hypothetical protein